MKTLAFDPGLTGACAVFNADGFKVVFDLPTMRIKDIGEGALVKDKIDGFALRSAILRNCPMTEEPVRAVVEDVRIVPGNTFNNAIQTQGSLLRSLGAIEGVVESLGLTLHYVTPQEWKKFHGLILGGRATVSAVTHASLECARRLFPECENIARVKDHNRAEAMLIGNYYRKNK